MPCASLLLLLSLQLAPRPGEAASSQGADAAAGIVREQSMQDGESRARAALEKVERHVARGQYEKALAEYQRLAERYPGTRAGAEAARRAQPNGFLGSVDLLRSARAGNRVDVLLLAEGYTLADQKAFAKAVAGIPRLFAQDPLLAEYAGYFNFTRVHLVSEESGVTGYGRTASTALDARIVSDASNTVFLAANPGRVGALLAQLSAPGALALVFVAAGGFGSAEPGLATLGDSDPHHLLAAFGRAFADLGSESPAATGIEGPPSDRVQPNISSEADARLVPWAHWIAAGVRGVGVHEGAGGALRGVYRPTSGPCWMGARGASSYCPVCREALLLAIYDQVDPIDGCVPAAQPAARLGAEDFALAGAGPHVFEVSALTPAGHRLRLRWWVLPESEAPPGSSVEDRSGLRPRHRRGPLTPIERAPEREERPLKGVDTFEFDGEGRAPGLYRVVCRVLDSSQLRGDRTPAVLRDAAGVLESERGWWVRVD